MQVVAHSLGFAAETKWGPPQKCADVMLPRCWQPLNTMQCVAALSSPGQLSLYTTWETCAREPLALRAGLLMESWSWKGEAVMLRYFRIGSDRWDQQSPALTITRLCFLAPKRQVNQSTLSGHLAMLLMGAGGKSELRTHPPRSPWGLEYLREDRHSGTRDPENTRLYAGVSNKTEMPSAPVECAGSGQDELIERNSFSSFLPLPPTPSWRETDKETRSLGN